MLLSSRRARVVQGMRVLIGIGLLTMMLSTQAQDVPTAEPVPQATEIVSEPPSEPPPTEEPIVVLPTEAVIIPTQEIIPAPIEPTAMPTQEITPVVTQETEIIPVPTEEVIAVPTSEATAEATTEAAVPIETDLPLAFSANFDAVPSAELSPQIGWLEVAVDDGKALQADLGAVGVNYTAATFTDAAVEARFLLNTGEGQVLLRGYTAGLKADGSVTLYRDQVEMTSTISPMSPEAASWATLRLQIVGSTIRVSVNDLLVLDSEDAALLPAGLAGFSASNGAVLRVDDFAVYGTGTPIVKPPSEGGKTGVVYTAGEPLVAPTGLTLSTNINHDAILVWNDTNDDEDRYEIERYVNAPQSPHATVGYVPGVADDENPMGFTETAIGCGLTVWYRVRATRDVDLGPWSSWKAVITSPCVAPVCVPGAAIKRVSVGVDDTTAYQSASIHTATGRSLSEDGRSVLFSSSNPLVGDPQGEIDAEGEIGANDSYIYNTTDCTTWKISVSDESAIPPDGETTEGAYPAAILNGPAGVARAIFYSASSDLTNTTVITDTDGFKDVFWRDHVESSTELVSLEDGGTVSLDAGDVFGINATIDGNYILMSMTDPVPGNDNNDEADLLLYDQYSNTPTLKTVTLNADNTETANDASFGGEVLVDPETGEVYVVFNSFAEDLIAGGENNGCGFYMNGDTQCSEVFVRNMSSEVTKRISFADNEALSNGSAIFDDAVIYKGKLYVTFQSVASNLVSGVNAGNGIKAYLRTVSLSQIDQVGDSGLGTTVMYARASNAVASAIPTGANATGPSYGGKLSSDARWIAFTSAATNLVAGDTNGKTDVFVRDLMTSMTTRVSPTTANTQNSFATDISADGTTVLFYSATSDLVPGDTANVCEVDFVDSQPDAGTQYDYNENCPDLFVVVNPLWVALAPPTGLTASVNVFEQIHLTWVAAVGADSYDIEYSENNFDWDTEATVGPVTAYDTDPMFCNEALYFRVRSRAGDARVSAFTPGVLGRSLACTAPVSLFPANNALLTDAEVEVAWIAFSASIAYEVDLSTVATFATHVIGYPKTTGPFPLLLDGDPIAADEQPLPDGIYYWRVRAKIPGEGPFSATRSFTVDTTMPDVPAFTGPANLAVVRTWAPTFTWVKALGVTYEIELSYTGGSTLFTQPATTPYTPPAFPQGHYTAVLHAFDAAGNMSTSTPLNYTINPGLLPAPNAVIPSVAGSATVKFTWAAAPAPLTAPAYTVEVDNDPFFGGVDRTCVGTAVAAPNCTINTLVSGTYYWRVVRAGEAELIIDTPPSNKLIVGFAAPRAPRLLTPLNGRFLPPAERTGGVVTLAWDWGAAPAVPPAGSPFLYQIEVSTSSLFDIEPWAILNTSIANAQTESTPSIPDGLYYWRVRAINTSGVWGAWSAGFNFVVDNVPPANAPNLLTPTPGSTVSTARPTFTWSPVTGAYRYEVKVVETADCAAGNLLHASTATILTTSYTISPTVAALAQGIPYVCVKAFDRSENETAFSTPVAFAVFLGTGPLNGAFIPNVPATTRPLFTWTAAPGIPAQTITYRVQLESDTLFDETGAYHKLFAPVATTSFVMPAAELLPVGTYYWRVLRLINGVAQAEVGAVSPYRKFYVGALTAGPALTATLPLVDGNTNLQWTAATPPAGTIISHYELVLSKVATFAPLFGTPHIILESDPLEYTFIPDPDQNRVTYYWRVRGLENGLPVTNWSMSSFIVDNDDPDSPTITAPLTNAIMSTVRPPISWVAVPGAINYRVKVYDNAAASFIDLDPTAAVVTEVVVNATILTYTPVVNLPQSTIRVDVTTFDGINISSPESSQTFVVRLGTAPAHNGVVTVSRPTFSWTAVTGATNYDLQIDNEPTFSNPIPYNITNIPATYILAAPQPALPDGVYYWRVKPNTTPASSYPDNLGSKMFTFNTNSKPGNPVLSNQTDTLINANEDALITFSWTAPALTPITYIMQVSTTPNFLAISDLYPTNATSVNVPEGNLSEGLNYWRVKAVYSADETNSVYSDVKTFTLDTAAPPAPSTTFVMDSILNTLRPTFTAGLSATATQYHFTLYDVTGTDPSFVYTPITRFDNKIVLKPATGSVVSYIVLTTLQSLDQGRLYAWGVEAEDAAGNISNSFIKRHFTVFVGKTPTNAQFVADTTPTFTWSALTGAGAATWKLQIAYDDDPSMTAPLAHETTVPLAATAVTYTVPNPAALLPGLYYWRVIRTSGADVDLTEGQPFYVVSSVASITPAPLLPLTTEIFNAEEVITGMDFLWTDIWEISGLNLNDYEVEIRKGLPTNPIYETLPACGCAHKLWEPLITPPDDIYHWRVRAVFDGVNPGPFGAWRTFRIDTTLPNAPALSLPVDTAMIINTRTPVFKWFAATGTPTRYVLEVSDTDDFSAIRYTATVLTPAVPPSTLTHTLPLSQSLPNGTYYWRVTARDAAGNPVDLSAVGTLATSLERSFIIAIP